jgi:hypothetical protein
MLGPALGQAMTTAFWITGMFAEQEPRQGIGA